MISQEGRDFMVFYKKYRPFLSDMNRISAVVDFIVIQCTELHQQVCATLIKSCVCFEQAEREGLQRGSGGILALNVY